jgi:hypothetical protein
MTQKFPAKGGLIPSLNALSQQIVIHSWECIIRRDRTCGRTGDPSHDPWNAPSSETGRFWTCTTLDNYVKEHPHG